MSTRVKFCGITQLADAIAAVEAGADYLGLIFVSESPRAISVSDAESLLQALRLQVPKTHPMPQIVGVFQNADFSTVQATVSQLQLDFVQLHGQENLDDFASLSCPIIAVIQNLAIHKHTHPNVAILLLDRSKTAPQENWLETVEMFLKTNPHLPPFWLAGGLSPETVQDAVARVAFHPAFSGVDVASGIEVSPGRKNLRAMQEFCKRVKLEGPV